MSEKDAQVLMLSVADPSATSAVDGVLSHPKMSNNGIQYSVIVSTDGVDILNPVTPQALLSPLNPVLGVASLNYVWDAADTSFSRWFGLSDSEDNSALVVPGLGGIVNRNQGFNGATYDRIRAANTFKTTAATALGESTVWTPAVGKKFRIMGGTISVCGTLAALAVQTIQLLDGTGGAIIAQFNAAVGATVSGDTQIPFSFENGFLSAAANNALIVKLGTAMASGSVAVNTFGTEE